MYTVPMIRSKHCMTIEEADKLCEEKRKEGTFISIQPEVWYRTAPLVPNIEWNVEYQGYVEFLGSPPKK